MSARISHIPFYEKLVVADYWLYLAGITYAVPIFLFYSWRPIAGIAYAVFPLAILLVVHAPTTLAAVIIASFLFIPLTQPIVLLPADAMALLLILAYIIDLLVRGSSLRRNLLVRPYLVYILVMVVSILLENFTFLSVRYFARQLVLFGTFMAAAHFVPRIRIRNYLIIFVIAAGFNGFISLSQFLASGGWMRTFGLAGLGFGDHAMLAVLISTVCYVWSRDLRMRWLWTLAIVCVLGALIATQTRASMITAGWGLMVIVITSWMTTRHTGDRGPRKNLLHAGLSFLLIISLLIAFTPIFSGVMYRFGRMGLQATGTILERMTLWKAALTAFTENPFFGIGIGNYPMIYNWVPEIRFDHIYYLVTGLSPHAISLGSLAETGIFGFISLSVFYFYAIRTARRNFYNAESRYDIVTTHALYIIALVIVGSSIYAGSWFWGNNSYHMAIFFGFIAGYRNRIPAPVAGGTGG